MIKSLSKETINKIAAGEVVERPLNVVKELCENSIDANATAISVEIKDGGKSLIRVTDNGCGIEPEECEIAFLRHTTSKIEDSKDLYKLQTLGFRGEALSSIAAVSKIELITKKPQNLLAKKVCVSGGEIISNTEIAAPNGSTFFVRELFFNTPARLKFLKSNQMESSAIQESFEKLALSRPDISFKLTIDGKEKIYTSGSGNLKNTIFEIYDLNTANSVLEINEECEYFKLNGYIGKSILYRGNRGFETFFVNKRYIKNSDLEEALERGYAGFLMQHGFPFCVLNLEFPSGSLDVNIHPSKMEVRFNDKDTIKQKLSEMIRTRLSEREDIEDVSLEDVNEPKHDFTPVFLSKPDENETIPPVKPVTISNNRSPEPFENTRRETIVSERISEIKEEISEAVSEQITIPFISEMAKHSHRIIGQVFDTYWLVEYDEKFYVIDQHAAHEKVLYERMMKSISDGLMSSQMIVPPIVVSLTPTEETTLISTMNSFTDIGFSLEHFGGHDYQINGIPATLPNNDPRAMFMEILNTGSFGSGEKVTQKVASMACKAAVKGNNRLSIPEIEALIDELLTLENPYHCPHGRPTMISFSRYELDKKFKRIV